MAPARSWCGRVRVPPQSPLHRNPPMVGLRDLILASGEIATHREARGEGLLFGGVR